RNAWSLERRGNRRVHRGGGEPQGTLVGALSNRGAPRPAGDATSACPVGVGASRGRGTGRPEAAGYRAAVAACPGSPGPAGGVADRPGAGGLCAGKPTPFRRGGRGPVVGSGPRQDE